MAVIQRFGWWRHLRAEPNEYILHYRRGHLRREGTGLAFWFNSYSGALALVPGEDCEAAFLLQQRSADFQEVHVMVTITYRIADPVQAATRVNFGVSLNTGEWLEEPLARLDTFWQQRARAATRRLLAQASLVDCLKRGADEIQDAIRKEIDADPSVADLGIMLVAVQVDDVAPSAPLEKALQTPTRESVQQKADEAVFQRRALAVEKERAIKENELHTEIELAQQQEQLIRRLGSNQLLEVQQEAESEQQRIEAQLARRTLMAENYAARRTVRATADAEAQRLLMAAQVEGERQRLETWAAAPQRVYVGLAMQEFAGKIDHIQHLNLTPNLLANAFETMLTTEAEQ